MSATPFRFGVVFTGSTDEASWPAFARRVESAGFSTLLVADHLDNPMACGPMMLAAGLATTTLRVGSYVCNNDFRHPALLAKEVATIDVLTGGRVELGLGAGWHKTEYDQVGLPFDPPGTRASRFEEAFDVIRRMLTGEVVDFHGEYYSFNGFRCLPASAGSAIPLLIGGGGPRLLELAARRADIVGFVPRSMPGGGVDPGDFTMASLAAKISRLEEMARASGRAGGGPERSILVLARYDDVDAVRESPWMAPETAVDSPYALIGEPKAVVDILTERRELLGLSYYVCFDSDLEKMLPVVEQLGS